ncbi:receptor-type tyrosine-protein phosphatase eta [Procambarus clarkii]|uniref:receptor-type tyrosine-protein phosphatase eta n=1 Tax=Procambarus clarkii TaxID=6728 RepID=UPI003743CBB3
MAVTGTTPWCFLLPLLVCWASSGVDSQTVGVTTVSTDHFELSWERREEWYGIVYFTINTAFPNGTQHPCNNKSISCTTPVCRYYSQSCGLIDPCSNVEVSVSGGTYTAPEVFITTAPPSFANVTVAIESANLTISWTNPAVEEPTCLKEANIQLELNNVGTPINSSGLRGFYWQGLCQSTTGRVRLWNVGGDGDSDVVLQDISYHGSDVVPLLDNITAIPGCTTLTVTWIYNNVCPEATHFRISLRDGEIFYTKDTTTTEHVFQDLKIRTEYTLICDVLDKDNHTVGYSQHVYLETLKDTVENLTVEAVSWSSIEASWTPSLCVSSSTVGYEVTLFSSRGDEHDVVFTTNYTWNNLYNNDECYVCVAPQFGDSSCVTLNTLLAKPSNLWVGDNVAGELHVTWSYRIWLPNGDSNLYYNVSWGPALQYGAVTPYTKYTIMGYNASDADRRVCVAAINMGTQNASTNTCLDNPAPPTAIPTIPYHVDTGNTGLIFGMSCLAIAVVAAVITGVVLWIRNKNDQSSD